MIEAKQEYDWWDELPDLQKAEIDNALHDLNNGKGISHEEFKNMYPQWFG